MKYRYDYFLDNCSTRLRDALDIVLGGSISSALVQRSTTHTYRSEVLRLNQHNKILFMGMDLALGVPSDRPLSAWEYSFVPMRLSDELQGILVPGPGGTQVPLAGAPRVLVEAEREAEPATIESRGVRIGILFGAIVLALAALGLSVRVRRGARAAYGGLIALGMVVHVVLGLLASLIVFMWAFTLHAFWGWNPHLLLLTPLSLVVAVLLPLSAKRARLGRWIVSYHFAIAACAFVVGVGTLIIARGPGAEMLVTWAGASWLFHLAFGLGLRRAAAVRPTAPEPPAAGVRIAA
jgi:hypothetical protein